MRLNPYLTRQQSPRYGTFYYSENEHYEGEWYESKRNGWGRMYYEDGSVYEGRLVILPMNRSNQVSDWLITSHVT